MSALLEVRHLTTSFRVEGGEFIAVDDVSFSVESGRTLGIVGESGCGKSVTSLSIMGLLPKGQGRIAAGSIRFDGVDLVQLSAPEMRALRGNRIAMIFQEPMTSLNPAFTIGHQLIEAIRCHRDLDPAAARAHAIEMLRRVRIPSPEQRIDSYPHKLSGGMRQRVMIAMALCCEPQLLIADEPTTALDVTIQAQLVNLLQDLQRRLELSYVFIAHDLAVVMHIASHVAVMYLSQIVEYADKDRLFSRPRHPYTQALLDAIPLPEPGRKRQGRVLQGDVPNPISPPSGCRFRSRCPHAQQRCTDAVPALSGEAGHNVACHFWRSIALPTSLNSLSDVRAAISPKVRPAKNFSSTSSVSAGSILDSACNSSFTLSTLQPLTAPDRSQNK